VGALLLGVSKRAAAEFSFFLSLPTMGGAVAYDLYINRDLLSFDDMGLIAIGFAMAFLSGLLVVRTLLDFVSRRGFAIFGWWRILVGGTALVLLSLGVLRWYGTQADLLGPGLRPIQPRPAEK
jgi:undecaprenyl-diphosphatase